MVVGACAHNQTQRAPPLLPRWAPPWPQVPRRVFCCFVVLPRQHLTTPHRTAPYHTTFHRIAPHRTAQHFTARHRTAPYRTASHRTAPHRNLSTNPTHTSPHHATRMPHCISPHHTHLTTPHSTARHRSIHCISPPLPWPPPPPPRLPSPRQPSLDPPQPHLASLTLQPPLASLPSPAQSRQPRLDRPAQWWRIFLQGQGSGAVVETVADAAIAAAPSAAQHLALVFAICVL